ncbi:o-succinylbenzoate--CoA ligase [Indiicoccus explosivorum]|uniref:o-succinylbenzoate--CoA ligase n=1 Tax=Indiicoccus explosivorum TaxID=1917864 RepID=UPI000B43B5D6|nr:o-succinylbenzoate--CoA ligase [Indiicoccus explosivorum]
MYPNWLTKRADLTGSRIGLVFEGQTWTFGELDRIAKDRAGKMAAAGLEAGSRVAILAKSREEAVFMIYGCLHLGCEMVMLNERLTAQELAYQLDDAEVEAVLMDDALQDRISHPRQWLFSDITKLEAADFPFSNMWTDDQVISIMYTSGTTGYPKGVKQTAKNHFSSAMASSLNIGISPEDKWLCMVPLFHISGFSILMRSLIYGAGVHLYQKFDEVKAAEELASGAVTHMSVVGVTLARILDELDQKGWTVSPAFRVMLAGGGPIATSHLERAERFGIPVLQTYGMTETASQTTTLSMADAARKPGSAGKPLFLYDVKLAEDNEILIRGPHVTPGYVGKFSDKNPTDAGYLKTGDIGWIDEDGFLFVLDRRSDLIVSGGENIYPAEIENVLMSHPRILEAGVCGIPDREWGEVPAAFIVADALSSEEVETFCEKQLAPYKIPKKIVFTDSLPRNASNKLLRRELRKWI